MTMNKYGLLISILLYLMASSLTSWSEVVVYANGDRYEGSFQDGLRDGEGT